MPTYRVNEDAVAQARKLTDAGTYDDTTEWADAAPSADVVDAEIEKHGYEGFAAWHQRGPFTTGLRSSTAGSVPRGTTMTPSRRPSTIS